MPRHATGQAVRYEPVGGPGSDAVEGTGKIADVRAGAEQPLCEISFSLSLSLLYLPRGY
ncbi:hypothetical protein F4818DRAFT_425994 [Hypoxylon cercidicola]|nr:hypothetical protein F4818DRAFT_425994 [Hypoxylon cercidicola]